MNLKILKYLKKYWFLAILTPLLMVGEVLVDLALPEIMAAIVDEGVLKGNMDVIVSEGIKMIIYVIIGGFFGIAASFTASSCAQNFGCDLRNDSFSKVMSLSLEQSDKFTTGSLVTRLTNDVTQVQDFVSMALRMMVRAPLNFIGGIIKAMAISASFSLVIVVALPIQLFFIIFIDGKTTPLFSVVQKKLDKVNSVVQENVTGARVVKAYVREDYENERFSKANTQMRDTSLKVQYTLAFLMPVIQIIMYAATIAIIYLGGNQVAAAKIGVGEVMEGVNYITIILSSLMAVSMMFQSVSRANASANRIREVLESNPVVKSGNITEKDETPSVGTVSFENVGFSYPNAVGDVLKNINLDIKSGEYLAILGATGCGKSSLVNLIPRFYDVTDGNIKIDGIDVKDYSLATLRKKIAFVLQKTELFSGTIADNIRWGKPDATDEEIVNACKIAQADGFITSFKDGYNTVIGQKGASLSGGQKQRIAIARAIVRNPEIIIFDDSTSALDLGTEAKLREALRENLKGTTIIMIAQRIASVMTADRIAVLENGEITACDSHTKLMKSSAAYKDIYDSQIREDKENG